MPRDQRFFLENGDRWPFVVPIGIGLGIGAYFSLLVEPHWLIGPLALIGLGAVTWIVRHRAMPRSALLVLCCIALGFTAASTRSQAVKTVFIAEETRIATIEGRVLDIEPYPSGLRVVIDHVRVSGLGPQATPSRVRLRLRGVQPSIRGGQWITARGRLSPPSPPVLPGGFDFQRHAFFKGLGATGFALGTAKIMPGPVPGPFEWRIHLSNLRLDLAARVHRTVGGDAGAVSAALLTGHRRIIPEDRLRDFRRAGLAHLLAISGLHIGLAAGIVFFGLRALMVLVPRIALRLPVKKVAAVAAIVMAFLYALLAGATVPTQRAFLIALFVLVAVIVDRRGISMRSLAWGATAILLFQPESLMGPSFQMSFAAAIALVAAYEVANERGSFRRDAGPALAAAGLVRYAVGVAFTTLVASAATAPFVIYHFNEVATFGLIANLVAVPVTALWVMPAAMGALLLLPVGLDGLALAVMGAGVKIILAVADWVADLGGAAQILPSAPPWALAALTLGGLWLCLVRGRARLLGLSGVAVCLIAVPMVRAPDILVSGDGKLTAVLQDGDYYAFSNLRAGRFNRENWLAHAGFEEDHGRRWRRDGRQVDGLTCDSEGCLLRRNGLVVSVSETYAAFAEDCWSVDLAVVLVPAARPCPKPRRVIGLYDLKRGGSHGIWLTNPPRVQTVGQERGARPWVVRWRSQHRDQP